MSNIPTSSNNASENDSLQDLCGDIEYNISTINSNKKSLRDTLKLIGTEKDTTALRNRISTIQNNSNKLATETTKHINRLKREVLKDNNQLGFQSKTLQDAFVSVIKDYSSLQQEILEKQKKHPLIVLNIESPSTDNDDELDSDGHKRQSLMMLDMQLDQERLENKAKMMTEVHTGILDLNDIFVQLGTLVESDGKKIGEIEKNVEQTAIAVEEGAAVLEKAAEDTSKHRKRRVIVIIICLLIIIILAIVLYFSIGK